MAAPVNANINILVNTQQAMAQLRALQGQVATLNSSISATSGAAAAQQAALAKGLKDSANASRMWQARIIPMNTATQQFSQALDKGRMSLGQYTRFAASQLPGMSRVFRREFEMMNRVATQNVRQMQTQYVQLARSATGASQAMALTPTALNKHAAASAIAAQRQMMMNRMIDLGTTKLLNWGKNTQWAGRQLMVGFSIPLAMVGAVAAKAFKEIDKGSIAFRRVYGDLSTTTAEMERNLEAVKALGNEYTRYGIKLADVIELSADVAATGAKNESLMAATEQTLRLATLGLMEYGEALDATIALQTAFQVSNEDLAGTIDFLNVVENETILTMQDMAAAIPRVAPVVKGLGGDVRDLAVFMTAMREGGVTAEQGANALKSGLGRLINPTKAAREVMAEFGMSIDAIIQSNKGDLMGMMQDFGNALATLGEFEQQQVLEKVFGKYQYARLGALFKNLANDASQANRTIELTNMSMEDLAAISERELGKIEEATSTKFQAAVERLKVSIAPVGEQFMKALMPVIDFVTKIANKFNDLPDNIKNAIAIGVAAIAGIGPIVLMTVGLIANGIANIGKLIQTMRKFFARLKGDASLFNYLTQEEREAATAANALSGATDNLTGKFLGQQKALERLIVLTGQYAKALGATAAAAPLGMGVGSVAAMATARGAATARGTTITGPRTGTTVTGPGGLRMATGGLVPGTGNKDTVPAMLTPGESVVTKEATQKYGPMIQAMNAGVKIPGFVNGVENLRGTYITGAGKLINPVAMMQPGAGGNQSVTGVSRSQFPTPTGQALFAGMGKSAMDLATRMQTLSNFSMSALRAFDPLDDLFNKIHGEVSSQLKNSATIDEAIQKAKPEVKKITSEYIKQKVLSGQMTKVEASRVRVATRLLMNEQSTVKRMGLIRAERFDVRGDKVVPRTQTEGKGAPLSTYRNLPRVAERELARRGLAIPRGFSQYERSHMESVGKKPFVSGMVAARLQGVKDLSAEQQQTVRRMAEREAQIRNQTLEQKTQDTAVIARDNRNSPHPIVTKDAQSDAAKYVNTVKQTLASMTPIRTGKPLVAASTPNLPQGTQFRAPGGGVAQVYNPRNNPLGLGITGEARAARGAIAAIESRTGILNRLRAEEEAQIAASQKFRVVDNRRTGATTKSAVLLEEENSFLTRANQAAQRLAAQRELNLTALRAEEQAQARLNGAKQRAAVMQETMNQRPARGGMLDRPIGALRRFAFPGGQDTALKNLGFNQFTGQVKTAGQLIVESAQNIKTRVAGTLQTLPADFKQATRSLLLEAKQAGSLLKTDFKGLGTTIKTNMIVDLKTLTAPIASTAAAIRGLGTSAAGAAQKMAGGIGNFMTSIDKNGTTRMQRFGQAGNGAVMGLMGLSMAASFAGGSVGEMAQKIMPITMGLMGLQMILPMLMNPFGLAIIATTALVGSFIYLRKQMDNAAKEAARMGANIGGVANGMKVLEEATGFKPPTKEDRLFRFTDEDREAMSEFGSYFESEAGSKFIQELREASSEERYQKVARLIAQGIASGMPEEKAKAFGFAIAEATGDALLKSSIARDFANQMFKSGAEALIDLEKERIGLAPTVEARPDYGNLPGISGFAGMGPRPGSMGAVVGRSAGLGAALGGGAATLGLVAGGLGIGAAAASPTVVGGIGLGAAAGIVALAAGLTAATAAAVTYIDALSEQKRATEEAAQGLGFALQTTQNLANAEAVLEEERRKGLITFDEYVAQQGELQKLQNQTADYIGKVFDLGADSGAMMQALEDQLSFAGFSEDQIKRVTQKFSPDALAKQFFDAESFADLEIPEQKDYVEMVFTKIMSGLTPENVSQRLQDIEGTYTNLSQDVVQKILDGTVEGIGDLDKLFNDMNMADFIRERMGGGLLAGDRRARQVMSPEQLAENITSQDLALKEIGTDALEVFTRLAEFTDQDFSKGIMASKEEILRFGDAVVKLADYEEISIEVVMRDDLDVDQLISGIEKIKEFKFDKDIFGKNTKEIQTTAMAAEQFVDILTETGQAAGKTGSDIEEAYGDAMTKYDELVDTVGKTKLGKIKITPEVIPMLFGQDVDNADQLSQQLNDALPDGLDAMQAQIVLSVMADPTSPIAQLFINNPALLAAVLKGGAGAEIKQTGTYSGGIPYTTTTTAGDIAKQAGVSPEFLDFMQQASSATGLTPPVKGDKKDTSGGGGGGTDPLEELQNDIMTRLALYTNLDKVANKYKDAKDSFEKTMEKAGYSGSLAAKLRKQNLSEMLIADILSKGAKFAQDMLNNIKKTKTLNRQMILSMAGEQISGLVQERRENRARVKAAGRLRSENFTSEQISDILSDASVAETLAGLEVGTKAWEDYIKQLQKSQSAADAAARALDPVSAALEEITKAQEDFDLIADRREAEFQAEFGRLDREYRPRVKAQEDIIKGLEDQRDVIQKQIDDLQELNSLDQRSIRNKQREIELLERRKQEIQDQIDDIQYQNELDQRRIDAIKREDELRNRVSEALNQELSIMSDIENKIRDSYQQRIDALDKIAEVNDYIINQQKNQLNLSQALSEGDIYAATSAAQEMRAASGQFAVQQTRAGIEQAMESQIAGLRTSEGLTRGEAEQRIQDIQQQSYQTSLMIRDIEDQIYQRNLSLVPLKDSMRAIDEQILGYQNQISQIQDRIYGRETEILNIQLDKLGPLDRQIAAEENKLSNLEDELQSRKDSYIVDGLTYDQHQDMIDQQEESNRLLDAGIKEAARYGKQVGKVVDQWALAAKNIAEANRLARDMATNINTVAAADIEIIKADKSLTPSEAASGVAARRAAADAQLAEVEARRQERIGLARQRAMDFQRSIGAYAGGLMKYAVGGMVNPLRYTSNEPPPAQMAVGGSVLGSGSRDSIAAMLTPGEFVVRKAMVDKYGVPMLNALNQGSFGMPRYNVGQPTTGDVTVKSQNTSNIMAPMYNNYSVNVSVSNANASADEIANRTIMKIKQMQDMQIRSGRGY